MYICHAASLTYQLIEIIQNRTPMSRFINIMYTWHSILNLLLIALSYKHKFSYTLYPALIGLSIRNTVRIMDMEGSRESLGDKWDSFLFQQIILSIFGSMIILIAFANLRGYLAFSMMIVIQLFASYLYVLDKDYASLGISAFIKDNWVVLAIILGGPWYLSRQLEIIKKIIVENVISLKKYKKFMNISEQGILILKER